jgi:siroheme synthase-like protein
MVPAIIDRSPLVISVASNGASPVLSRQIRTQLKVLFHMVWVSWLSFLENGVNR